MIVHCLVLISFSPQVLYVLGLGPGLAIIYNFLMIILITLIAVFPKRIVVIVFVGVILTKFTFLGWLMRLNRGSAVNLFMHLFIVCIRLFVSFIIIFLRAIIVFFISLIVLKPVSASGRRYTAVVCTIAILFWVFAVAVFGLWCVCIHFNEDRASIYNRWIFFHL